MELYHVFWLFVEFLWCAMPELSHQDIVSVLLWRWSCTTTQILFHLLDYFFVVFFFTLTASLRASYSSIERESICSRVRPETSDIESSSDLSTLTAGKLPFPSSENTTHSIIFSLTFLSIPRVYGWSSISRLRDFMCIKKDISSQLFSYSEGRHS